MAGVSFVRLRWITTGITVLHFVVVQNYSLAFLVVLWPVLNALIVFPGKLNRILPLIAESMGYASKLQLKALLSDDDLPSAEKKISLRLPGKQKKTVMPIEDPVRNKQSQI